MFQYSLLQLPPRRDVSAGVRVTVSIRWYKCRGFALQLFLTVGVGERATEGILSCENWRELMNVGNEFTVDGLCGIQESMKYFGRRQSFYELLGFHGKSRWYPVIQRVGWSRAPDGTRVQISNLLPSGTALVSSKEWMCYIHEKGKDVTHLEKISMLFQIVQLQPEYMTSVKHFFLPCTVETFDFIKLLIEYREEGGFLRWKKRNDFV